MERQVSLAIGGGESGEGPLSYFGEGRGDREAVGIFEILADKGAFARYFSRMSFEEVMAELPALSVAERQLLVRCALELDELGLSQEDETLVEQRLGEHRRDPDSAVALEEIKARLRSRFSK